MISVDLSALWSDETDRIIKGILEATENIQTYIDCLRNRNLSIINCLMIRFI